MAFEKAEVQENTGNNKNTGTFICRSNTKLPTKLAKAT